MTSKGGSRRVSVYESRHGKIAQSALQHKDKMFQNMDQSSIYNEEGSIQYKSSDEDEDDVSPDVDPVTFEALQLSEHKKRQSMLNPNFENLMKYFVKCKRDFSDVTPPSVEKASIIGGGGGGGGG